MGAADLEKDVGHLWGGPGKYGQIYIHAIWSPGRDWDPKLEGLKRRIPGKKRVDGNRTCQSNLCQERSRTDSLDSRDES